MNKRQKITISIVGITIVLLALLGLTYAYYLTRIQGNTNTNSISVTTAKLELVYGDNSAEILTGTGALMPTVETDADDAIGTKTFTVTNNGNDSSYVVVIDNVSITKASDGSSTSFVSNDFRYTLSCTKSDGTNCNNVSDLTIFPIKGGILVSNDIEEDDVHTYTLTMWYIDTGIDQSDDMGKTYQARVNIADVNQMENPFKTGVTATDNASLAYNIIKNAKANTNGTKLLNVADTPVAEGISTYKGNAVANESHGFYGWDGLTYGATAEEANNGSNPVTGDTAVEKCESVKTQYISDSSSCNMWCDLIGKVADCTADGVPILENVYTDEQESSLVVEQDDLGTSYYYRGNVEDNYVTFADMCWRIIRINGDGTTKLILEDQDQPCSEDINGNWGIPTTTGGSTYTGNFGYTQYNKNTLTASDGTQNSGTKYIMDYLHGETNSASSMATAFKNFQSTFTETELSKLKSGNWCLGDAGYSRTGSSNSDYTYTLLNETQMMDNKIKGTSFYYDSYVRLSGANKDGFQPTLKCNGTIMNDWDDNETDPTPMYVGGITADEMVYAGASWTKNNLNFYLMNDSFKNGELDYYYFWSLSPDYFGSASDYAFGLYDDGNVSGSLVNNYNGAFRPAVSLASSAVISSGEGTLESPYVIG